MADDHDSEAITIPPFRPSEGYLAFIDFQSASELNNAHSDLRVRQDAGDLLPVYRSAPNVWLRNDKIIFTIWNKEKEEERKLQAPSTREERHCNRGAFTHYTLRIADLPLNTTKADVRRLFPEIRLYVQTYLAILPSHQANMTSLVLRELEGSMLTFLQQYHHGQAIHQHK